MVGATKLRCVVLGIASVMAFVVATPVLGATVVSFAPATNYATGDNSNSVAVADLNADGNLDLAVANQGTSADPDSVSILLGTASGTFGAVTNYSTAPAGTAAPSSVVVGDVNGDDKPDVLTIDLIGEDITIFAGNGDGTLATPTRRTFDGEGADIADLALADFNGDGVLDLAWTSRLSVSVALGNGDGTFGAQNSVQFLFERPLTIVAGDFNGDVKADIAFTGQLSTNAAIVLLGNGDGTFGAGVGYGSGTTPNDVDALTSGDVNGDSLPDLAMANAAGGVTILLGNGDGSFTQAGTFGTDVPSFGAVISDLNVDGKPDIALTNTNANGVGVLLGTGTGTFGSATVFGTDGSPGSVSSADFDTDGRPDLVTANQTFNTVSVLLNTTDIVPPQTTITSGPSGLTTDPTPTFGLASSEVGSTFECMVDMGSFESCTSPHTTSALSNGPHTFSVRATDVSGNTDPTPAMRSFRICTGPFGSLLVSLQPVLPPPLIDTLANVLCRG